MAALTLASLAGGVAAEPARHVVVPVSADDPSLDALAGELTAGLVSALEGQGHAVELSSVSMDDVRAMLACRDDALCLRELAVTMDAAGVVAGQVAARPGGVAVTVTWVTGEDVYEDRFDIDTGDSFAAQARAFAERRPYAAPPPPVQSQSRSPSASAIAPTPVVRRRGVSFRHVRRSSWAIAAGGAATMTVGALFLQAGNSSQRSVDAAPTDTVADFEALEGYERSARRNNALGTVCVVAGGAALVAGTVLVVRDVRSSRGRLRVTATPPPASGAGVFVSLDGAF